MARNKTPEHPADLATNSHGTGFAGYANNAKIPVTGTAMVEVEDGARVEPTAEMIRAQLDLMVPDEVFRSSKRSIAFLRYVVEQTLKGAADQSASGTHCKSYLHPASFVNPTAAGTFGTFQKGRENRRFLKAVARRKT